MKALLVAIAALGCANERVTLWHAETIEQVMTNDLDILFMVDDSSSMTPVQTNLIQNFPALIDVLKTLPAGLPNVRIAVTTSSMGAGAFTSSVPGCMTPDFGRFITQNRSSTSCPPTGHLCADAQLGPGASFIESLAGGTVNNFSGDIADVFCCLAQVGSTGCGFEQPLEAVRTALGDPVGDPTIGVPPRPGNPGFLRADATLAIVMITDEDDCSVPPDSLLFDPSQSRTTDPLGPLASFRCTEFGIRCSAGRPPRAATGPLGGCTSNDDAIGADRLRALVPARFYADYFRRLKAEPDRVLISAVAGPAEPFLIFVDSMTQYPTLQHSCSSSNMTFADPAVRLKAILDSAGDRGTFTSICQNNYAGAMQTIAARARTAMARQCAPHALAEQAPVTRPLPLPAAGMPIDPATITADVQLVDSSASGQTPLGACALDGSGGTLCWTLRADPACQGSGARLDICARGLADCAPGMALPAGTHARLRYRAVF
jgi:hypothetical protein